MAARDDILEKVKKSRQQAEQRIQESNRQAQAERQESQKTYQQNTSSETKKAASYMQDYSSKSRAGNTVAAYAEKRKRSTQWYKGSEPTEAETLAQILKKGEHDDNLGRELYGLYEQAKAEGHWAETYDKPTSQYLTALGIEDPSVINDEFIDSLTPYLAAGVNTSTGGLSSAKKNGPEAMLAYNVGGLISDYQDTKELLAEQEQAAKEAQYWIAKGLTDDEIKEKLNIGGEGSKYTKLTSAINKTSTGGVVPTTAPIPLATSYGVDGMLYALRNPDSSKGDLLLDAVQKELGRGVQTQDNPAAKARRTPGSETWNPYINGTTMDDEGIRFGTTQFDKGWLDANRQAILSSGNEDDVKAFTRIYNAEERTAAAESELSDLTSSIEMQLQADPTQDADALIASIFGSSDDPTYKTLAAMDKSLLSGAVLDMTRGVAYDRKSIEKYIRDYVADAQLREQATVDPAAMNTVVEQDKAAAAEENGGSLIKAGSFLESVPAAVQKSVFGETVDPEMMVEGWTWILNGAKGLFKKNKQEEETAPAEPSEETPEGSAHVPAEPIAVVASVGMSDVRPQAPKTDAETQEFLDRWFGGKIPTDDEFAEKYEAVLNDPSVPDADVKYFFERGTEIVGKAQDDVENYQQEVDTAQQTTSDIAEAGTKHLTAEEAQTATVLMNDFLENGQYADAAALQFSVLTSAVTDSNDQYVRELVTSVGGQEAAVQLANLVLQGDMVSQVNDPSVREALTQYENYIWAALDSDEESKLTFAKALDFVSGGTVSDTADNEGVGLFQMLKSTFVKGASGINDSWANLVGAAMTGYGHAVKGTNWIVNNTLGKIFGFQLNDSAAETTIQAGQDVSSYYDKIGAKEDAYLRENASTLEYFVATAGGEAIKMGAQSVAGSAIGGKVTDTVGKIMNKGGLRQLTTAMDLSKVEGLMSKVVSASPFIADSFGNEYQEAYSETQNPATATLSALVSAFSTTALMNMDAIKNIENMGGKLIPEVVDAIKAIPGSSLTASFKRFGKAGMMYIGNMLKTAANEAIQEPTENLLTTWATDAIKGKNFFDRDMKAFGQELAQDAFYAAIGTFGNSMASLPSWSRSAIYADQMMGKTGLTMQEVKGQVDAFIADMNDPQVVAQTQANLTAAAEQYVTGELLQQGALGEVNAQPVLKAQEKLDAANTSLNEAVKNMQIVSEQRDTASARFAENPADPKATSNMLAAVDAYNKAAQETETAQAVQAEAKAKLDEASAALKEQTDTAMEAVREQAKAQVEQRVQEIRKFNYSDVDTEANIQEISQMESVASLTGREFEVGGNNLRDQVSEYFDSIGNMATNPVLGDVALSRKGAKSSLAHGIGPEKAAAFAAVPAVIENGQVIDLQQNWKGRGYDTFVVAAPITLGDEGYLCGVVVKRSQDNQQFYVHEVILENTKKEPSAALQPTVQTGEPSVALGGGKAPSVNSLLQKVRDVKRSPAEADNSVLSGDGGAQQPSGRTGISQFAVQTGQNTTALSDSVKNELRESPYYQKTTRKGNVDKAISAVETEGYETRRNKLLDGTTNLYTPEGQAEAFVLARIAKENGDVSGESAIAFKVKESGTLLGQSLAMLQLYVQMTPEGKQQFVQRIVDQINDGYAKKGKDTRVSAPDWLAERLEIAKGDEEATWRVLNEAYAYIAEQMPPDWKDRLNAWRYTAMLANPRTHIRNVVGNAAFVPVIAAKNKVAALLELNLDKSERTKSLGPIRSEYKEFARSQLESVRDMLTGGGKHSPMDEIQANRRSFNNSVLEWISKGNGKALEAEDAFFLNNHFVNAFAGFLQARGADINNLDKATLNEGLDYAINEAQKATYRDASEIADKISKLSRELSNSDKLTSQAAGLLVEGALPFKKTPINVMKRGIEYSPVGLLTTLATWESSVRKGSATQAEIFDRLASGLTGTALSVVGGLLFKNGLLKLSLDDPEDELEKLQGSQEYSIELFGKSVTIDWLSPSAMPLFVGGAIAELMSSESEELNLNTFSEALMNIAEPVFNLSMLDGVNTLLSAASYSENGVVDIAMRAAEGYAGQFVPTVLGAVARTFDSVRRTTYTDKTSGIPNTLQYLADSTINKIPGLSQTGQPYLNAWGEEDITDSFWQRVIENFISPGYINNLDPDTVEQHLMELFDATGEAGLIPKTPQKYFTAGGERVDLTGEQYEQLTKERGQTAKRLHEELFANPDFLSMPAEYQVDALGYVWDYSTTIAKSHIADGVSVSAWMEADDPVAEIMNKAKDKMAKDQNDAFKNDLYSAIDSGDAETAATYVAGLIKNGVTAKSLKNSATSKYKKQYKQMYEDGDVSGMRELEKSLILLNIGYRQSEFTKWLD